MSSSPPEVALRPLGDADAEAAAALIREVEREVGYRAATSVAEVREWWSRTDLAANSWAAERDDGGLLALAWLEARADAGEYNVQLRPDEWDDALALRLVELAEARVCELGFGTVRGLTLARHTGQRALFEARGYEHIRSFFLMTIELDARPPEPRPPEGIRIEAFRRDDARAFHDVLHEAFADEWGFVPVPFEEWFARRVERADTSFYFVARTGDGLAGILRGEPEARDGGFVGTLGVRRRWRGRGVGQALLQHAFRAWYDAGKRRVSLGVDSENPTGATRLYERVGMHVELEDVVYERALE